MFAQFLARPVWTWHGCVSNNNCVSSLVSSHSYIKYPKCHLFWPNIAMLKNQHYSIWISHCNIACPMRNILKKITNLKGEACRLEAQTQDLCRSALGVWFMNLPNVMIIINSRERDIYHINCAFKTASFVSSGPLMLNYEWETEWMNVSGIMEFSCNVPMNI